MTRYGTVALVGLTACSGVNRNPVVPDPKAPIVAPTVQPTPETIPPTPTPVPQPTHVPQSNHPPTVAITFPGPSQCHPHPQPCTVAMRAKASDPDGDRLTYRWSGCTFGTDELADCRVTGPTDFEAVVEVSDERGGTARDSVVTRGINLPPDDVFGPVQPPYPSQAFVALYGNVSDPESGALCGHQYCLDAHLSGPCGPTLLFQCTCLAGAGAEFRTTNGPGECVLTYRVRDDLGAVATLTTRFQVLPP